MYWSWLRITSLFLALACYVPADESTVSDEYEVDILFVIDNSPSMAEEMGSLALNISNFVEILDSAEVLLDYKLAITTTSADYSSGKTNGIDPGEAGTFLGDPTVLSKGDEGVAELFEANLLCEAAYWSDSSVPSDPAYECGDANAAYPSAAAGVEPVECV